MRRGSVATSSGPSRIAARASWQARVLDRFAARASTARISASCRVARFERGTPSSAPRPCPPCGLGLRVVTASPASGGLGAAVPSALVLVRQRRLRVAHAPPVRPGDAHRAGGSSRGRRSAGWRSRSRSPRRRSPPPWRRGRPAAACAHGHLPREGVQAQAHRHLVVLRLDGRHRHAEPRLDLGPAPARLQVGHPDDVGPLGDLEAEVDAATPEAEHVDLHAPVAHRGARRVPPHLVGRQATDRPVLGRRRRPLRPTRLDPCGVGNLARRDVRRLQLVLSGAVARLPPRPALQVEGHPVLRPAAAAPLLRPGGLAEDLVVLAAAPVARRGRPDGARLGGGLRGPVADAQDLEVVGGDGPPVRGAAEVQHGLLRPRGLGDGAAAEVLGAGGAGLGDGVVEDGAGELPQLRVEPDQRRQLPPEFGLVLQRLEAFGAGGLGRRWRALALRPRPGQAVCDADGERHVRVDDGVVDEARQPGGAPEPPEEGRVGHDRARRGPVTALCVVGSGLRR